MNDMRQRGDHPGETELARRERILHEELERRLGFFESSDDSDFGAFTASTCERFSMMIPRRTTTTPAVSTGRHSGA